MQHTIFTLVSNLHLKCRSQHWWLRSFGGNTCVAGVRTCCAPRLMLAQKWHWCQRPASTFQDLLQYRTHLAWATPSSANNHRPLGIEFGKCYDSTNQVWAWASASLPNLTWNLKSNASQLRLDGAIDWWRWSHTWFNELFHLCPTHRRAEFPALRSWIFVRSN